MEESTGDTDASADSGNNGGVSAASVAETPSPVAPHSVTTEASMLEQLSTSSTPSTSLVREATGDDVHSMLATAAARQQTFQDIRDASLEIGVRDMRRCDYPMDTVSRAPSARGRRGNRLMQSTMDGSGVGIDMIAPVSASTSADNSKSDSSGFEWRRHLKTHVAQLMMELRLKPDQLKVFLSAHYPQEGEQDHGDDSSDEEVIIEKADREGEHTESTRKRSSIYDISPLQLQRHLCKFLSVKDVYKKLSEIAFQLGEALYQRIRQMLLKSVRNGVIDRAANLIRLESMFKLELRRQVTIERLEQNVVSTQENYRAERRKARKRREMKKRQKAPVSGDVADAQDFDIVPKDDRLDIVSTSPMTAHQFKMHALERMLSSEWTLLDPESLVPRRPDQFEDLIQEKVTSVIYSKTRENYPFWKDSTEQALSRDETTKLLRVVVSAFTYVPIFQGLNVDQLIEVAKYFKWRSCENSETVCTKDTSMDQLFVVIEGQVSADSGTEVLSILSRRMSSRLDDRRSMDSVVEHRRTFFGEIGLLSKTETWPFTLFVKSTQAKLLILPRDAFDSALSKMFGTSKRQLSTKDGIMGRRPMSSPASTRLRTRMLNSRPASSAVRDNAVAKSREYRDKFLQQAAAASTPVKLDPSPSLQKPTPSADTVIMTASPAKKRAQSNSICQNYPSFPISNGASPGLHMFRLKCIQPIAFGMRSVEDMIQEEWAPAFPDTSTLVDYMSTVDSFLFEKRNVLIKSNLRGVCANLPFQDDLVARSRADEYFDYYQVAQADPRQDTPGQSPSVTFAGSASIVPGSLGRFASQVMVAAIEDDSMTLNQFADARKRIFGRLGASFGGAPSPSMRNVLASSATSATLAKNGHAPFVNSSFVPESSFSDSIRPAVRTQLVLDENYIDVDPATHGVSTQPEVDETDESEDDESQYEVGANESAGENISASGSTNAQKMALDSLVQSMSSGSASKKILDGEAARRVILQKHLFAAKQGPSTAATPATIRKRSLRKAADSKRDVIAASHAPLPLRVDLQRRMEAVLAALKLKPKAKLDLVLKYTHADHYDLFPDAVVLWEQAMHYIQKREKALEALRDFELVASDPRRHFRSLSTHRLAEQKGRDALFYQLNYASDLCRESLDELEKRCGDTVYLDGRLYTDKMKKDYTELLYEVELDRLKMIYKDVHPAVGERPHESVKVGTSGNQLDDRRLENHIVSGISSAPCEPRFALSTPRESIFVSVVDRRAQEERDERQQALRQATVDATPKLAPHKLAIQVQQHRHAQLDKLTIKRGSQPLNTPRPTMSPAPEAVQVRSASVVQPPPPSSTKDSLKQALERVLRGRR